MGRATDAAILRDLRTVFDGGSVAGLADGPLLERFARRSDELAFAVLVGRHGPMVWRVCRATLRDEHEAEDAFQAVFLVLATKARTLWVRDSLGPWLHQVALRTASFARAERRRRRGLERRWSESHIQVLEIPDHDDPSPVIHEELGKLPERYRAAVLLCDLEGLSHEDAARRLGWPVGTVKSRQSRGRARLRERLERRGLGPAAGAGILAVSPSLPASLPSTAIAAAMGLAGGGPSPGVMILMKGVLLAMTIRRSLPRAVAASALVVGSVASVAALAVSRGGAADGPPSQPQAPAAIRPAPRATRDVLRDVARAIPEGEKADVDLLLQIARAQARAGDRDGALVSARRVSGLIEDGDRASASNLITLAHVYAAAGDRNAGLKELDRADRLPDEQTGAIQTPLAGGGSNWFPARRLIAEARVDLGDLDAARATVQVMLNGFNSLPMNGQRVMAAPALAGAQIAVGDVDGAFRTADQVIEPKSQSYNYSRGQVLGEIAQASSRSVRWGSQPRRELSPEERAAARPILARVEEVAEGFEFAEEKPYVEQAIAWANLGEFDAALRVAHRIGQGPTRSPNATDRTAIVYVLSTIANTQGRAGRKADAAATVREVLDILAQHPDFLPGRFEQVAGAQLAAGDEAGALRTMESSGSERLVRWLVATSRRQSEAGDRPTSRAHLRRALEESKRRLNAPVPPPLKVEEDLRRRFPADWPADRERAHKDGARSDIAAIHARLGDLAAATEALRAIEPGSRSARLAAQSIARARVEEGDAGGALDWALLLDPPLRIEALRGLAVGVAER